MMKDEYQAQMNDYQNALDAFYTGAVEDYKA